MARLAPLLVAAALVLALQLTQWLPAAHALSPADIAAKLQPPAAATSRGAVALSTYSLYSYYQEVEFDVEKASRAGPLLAKAAKRSGTAGYLEEVLKQLAKKRGKPARSFFAQFATKVAGECACPAAAALIFD